MSERLFTIKEIAELLEVSKPTVERAIIKLQIEADDKGNKAKKLYGEEKTRKIIKDIKPSFNLNSLFNTPQNTTNTTTQDNTTLPTKSIEENITPTKDNTTPQTPPQTATNNSSSEVELLKSVVATLQEQLTIKDKQIDSYKTEIEAKNKQIDDYSRRLAESLELTKGQLLVSAQEKLLTSGEDSIKTVEPIEENKQPFFKRLFKRNK